MASLHSEQGYQESPNHMTAFSFNCSEELTNSHIRKICLGNTNLWKCFFRLFISVFVV